MKKTCYFLSFILFLFFSSLLFADTAVLPYKVESADSSYDETLGAEYAKLVALAMYIQKGIAVYSHDLLEKDLQEFSIDPQGVVESYKLDILGKTRYVDRIQLGTLTKSKKGFAVKSIVYDVATQKIASRCTEYADTLFELAQMEMRSLYLNYPDSTLALLKGAYDIAFLVDNSYSAKPEWKDIKRGIIALCDSVSDNWFDMRVYVVPMIAQSKKLGVQAITSATTLDDVLQELSLAKGIVKSITPQLNYIAKGLPWRKDAKKICVIIAASSCDYNQSRSLRFILKKNNVNIVAIGTGSLVHSDRVALTNIADSYYDVTYHQRMYDVSGTPVDVFWEAGRIFHGDAGERWKNGVTTKTKAAKPFVAEIFGGKESNCYELSAIYPKLSSIKILNSEPLQNNIVDIFEMIAGANMVQGKTIARVLLSDGGYSLWLPIADSRVLGYCKQNQNIRMYIGISPQQDVNAPYGVGLLPVAVTGVPGSHIPSMLKMTLKDIIEHKGFKKGLFNPPVWFVPAVVKKIIESGSQEDIRNK
ncbi:MAG: VWA domain-containing protein [Spirochaetes bacterium]|nr:VWA domain-containing protein [Spirochaetota bacterium]